MEGGDRGLDCGVVSRGSFKGGFGGREGGVWELGRGGGVFTDFCKGDGGA